MRQPWRSSDQQPQADTRPEGRVTVILDEGASRIADVLQDALGVGFHVVAFPPASDVIVVLTAAPPGLIAAHRQLHPTFGLVVTSAPPELPGLMVASVWIASLIVTLSWPLPSLPPSKLRCRALTMPAVTDPSSPSGFPMASTVSPTCSWSLSPKVAACRPETPSAWITAQVGGLVGPNDAGGHRPAVAELDGDAAAAGALDDVVVGHDEAVGGEDHAGSLDLLAGGMHRDRHHALLGLGGDAGQRAAAAGAGRGGHAAAGGDRGVAFHAGHRIGAGRTGSQREGHHGDRGHQLAPPAPTPPAGVVITGAAAEHGPGQRG
jgi:hypothetical protein